jgi:arylformamidase
VAYGAAERQRLDVARPAGPAGPRPCIAFLHGGFWQEGSIDGSGFAARSLAAEGFATAAIGYRLAPDVSVTQIVGDVVGALAMLRTGAGALGIDPTRIVLAGHSAGAHLAACIACGLGPAAALREDELPAGLLLVSGIFDLVPVTASYVNDLARMSDREAEDLSPLLARPRRDIPVHVVVGADEPDAFRVQSDALAAAWAPALSTLTVEKAAGRDHFDILDELADGASATRAALRGMAARNDTTSDEGAAT